jgi:stage II sporulation protein M
MISGVNNHSAFYTRYKLWLLIAIGLFAIGIAAGVVISLTMPVDTLDFFSEDLESLAEIGSFFEPFTATLAVFIFFKNAIALLFSFIFSPILCLIPIFSLLLNSTLIPVALMIVAEEESIGYILAGILPHGIIEISAFIIGEAAALHFGFMCIITIFSKDKSKLLPAFKKDLKYLVFALILLVPAAIIETFVTPLFIM